MICTLHHQFKRVHTVCYILFVAFMLPSLVEAHGTVTHSIAAVTSLIARFMGPTWGPSGSDRIQVGPMLVSWTLLSGEMPNSILQNSEAHDFSMYLWLGYLFVAKYQQSSFIYCSVSTYWNHQQCCWFLYVETCNFGETNPQYRAPEYACQVRQVLMT